MNLHRFNRKDATVVITSYPNPKDGSSGSKGFNAVGWHSRKTLQRLSKTSPVLVLAEKRSGPKTQKINDNLTVARVWEKGSILSLLSLIGILTSLNKVKSVFVQFEFNVFGGIIPNLTLLFVLMLARLMGKNVTFELHQVITDVGLLKKHVPVGKGPLRIFFNISLRIFYVLLGLIVSDVIVFEQMLKNRLRYYIRGSKVHVLSLSVEPKRVISKEVARRKLKLNSDEFIVMVFGFINGYKGIDWIVNSLSEHDSGNMRLLVAGGINPYLKDKPYYQKFYNGIVSEIKKHDHMTYSGFVPDEMVDYYFAACDVVVLPYEVFMSASGPFSLALSYKKPVLLSSKLKSYSESEDFVDALIDSDLSTNDLFFPLTQSSLLTRLHKLQKASSYRKYVRFSTSLAEKRASEVVVRKLRAILHAPSSLLSTSIGRVEVAKA